MHRINRGFKNIADAFANFVNSFNHVLGELFGLSEGHLTRYCCSRCNGTLILKGHDGKSIFYQCVVCGKTHKAYKNNVLGRFCK